MLLKWTGEPLLAAPGSVPSLSLLLKWTGEPLLAAPGSVHAGVGERLPRLPRSTLLVSRRTLAGTRVFFATTRRSTVPSTHAGGRGGHS